MNSIPGHRLRWLALSAVLICLGCLPLVPLGAIGGTWHDLARLFQGPVFLATSLCVASELWRRISFPVSIKLIPLWAVLFGLVIASCSHAAVPAAAWREVAVMIGLATVGAATALALANEDCRRFMAIGVTRAASASCTCFLGLVLMALVAHLGLDNARLVLGFDNPRFLNHAQTVLMPLLAGIAGIAELRRRWRYLAWFALSINFALLALTLGRSTALSLLALGAVAVVSFGPAGRRFAGRLALAALAGGISFWVLFRILPAALGGAVADSLNAEAGLGSDHSRLYLWRIALHFMAESPWLGIGPMHFAHHPNHGGAHPHNIYLQLAAEFGLPAAVLMFAIAFLALARRGLMLRRDALHGRADALALAAFLACVGVAVDGMFSGNFVMPISQGWIALAAGLLFARSGESMPVQEMPRPLALKFGTGVLGLLLLASQFWLLSVMVDEWAARHAREYRSVVMHGVGTAPQVDGPWRPRFWLDGWF